MNLNTPRLTGIKHGGKTNNTYNASHSSEIDQQRPHHQQRRIGSFRRQVSPRQAPRFVRKKDAVIVEIGSRYLRAGFEGESVPQCELCFGPEQSRRVGDFRGWSKGYVRAQDDAIWAEEHELWRPDLRDYDLGLIQDKIERAMREAYNDYLLTNAGVARLVLVLPSILPSTVLGSVLQVLFERWEIPTITLLPGPTMSVVSAGMRSGLVVDIGWHETVAAAVFELREVASRRSTRAMKRLMKIMKERLRQLPEVRAHSDLDMSMEYLENVLARLGRCSPQDTSEQKQEVIEADWPASTISYAIRFPLDVISGSVERDFYSKEAHPDDQDEGIANLVYKTLLNLSPDVRGECMSRIVVVGGGSQIPGVKDRLLAETQQLVDRYGWNGVRGEQVDKRYGKLRGVARAGPQAVEESAKLDPTEASVQQQQAKKAVPHLLGQLRVIESLGAWAGASLVASLKIKGFVEIEKDEFLKNGLRGAPIKIDKNRERSILPPRTSLGPGTTKAGDGPSWTLAGWD